MKARTRPAPGNHEFHSEGATFYFEYFGKVAGDPKDGFYSYDLGAWHVPLNGTLTIANGAINVVTQLTAADDGTTLTSAKKNGTALDGTPIIRNVSDIQKLTQQGYVTQTSRSTGTDGPYFICPVFKDPRNGAIAPDAHGV